MHAAPNTNVTTRGATGAATYELTMHSGRWNDLIVALGLDPKYDVAGDPHCMPDAIGQAIASGEIEGREAVTVRLANPRLIERVSAGSILAIKGSEPITFTPFEPLAEYEPIVQTP